MRLRARLHRLERNLPSPAVHPEQCRLWYVGALVVDDAPEPPAEEIPRCRTCGGRHVIRETLMIVGPSDAGTPREHAATPGTPGC
jgi:hypothetical protein